MSRPLGQVLACALVFVATATAADAEKRWAFVAGIDDYSHIRKLENATADAGLVAQTLELSGFVVRRSSNSTKAELDRDWQAFLNQIKPGDFAVVYFAGHGVQKGGANYLLPVDFTDTDEAMGNAVSLGRWLGELAARKPVQKIIILDACRDNPLKTGARGLAAVQSPAYGQGTYIVFVTAPGEAAKDGVFAKNFVRELRKPGRRVDEVFNATAAAVQKESSGGQVPFAINSGGVTFPYFSKPDRIGPLALAHDGQCAQAIPRLQTLLTVDSDDGAVLVWLGHCQILEKDPVSARRSLERARKLVDLSPHVIDTELALAALEDGEIVEATLRLQDALKEQPDYPEALMLKGKILLKEQQYSQAVNLFDGLFQRLESEGDDSTSNLSAACTLLADALKLNGVVAAERAQRSRCAAIAHVP